MNEETPNVENSESKDDNARVECTAEISGNPEPEQENQEGRESTLEVEASSQPQRGMRAEIMEDENGEWHWMLFSKNGRPLATNVEGYSRKMQVINAFEVFRRDILAARIVEVL